MYPSVLERIGEMSQMRLNVCARLPADHPFQPPMIEPIHPKRNDLLSPLFIFMSNS